MHLFFRLHKEIMDLRMRPSSPGKHQPRSPHISTLLHNTNEHESSLMEQMQPSVISGNRAAVSFFVF